MQRKRRVPNPDHHAIAVNWSLHFFDNAGIGNGRLDLEFRRSPGFRSVLSLPCAFWSQKCLPRKVGEKKVLDKDGKVVSWKRFSILPPEGKDMDSWAKIINNLIEYIAKTCSSYLPRQRKPGQYVEGTTLVPPKLLRIPRKITVTPLSLEGLQEEGLLPMDLENFRRM